MAPRNAEKRVRSTSGSLEIESDIRDHAELIRVRRVGTEQWLSLNYAEAEYLWLMLHAVIGGSIRMKKFEENVGE